MTPELARKAASLPGFTYDPAQDRLLIPGEDDGYCVGMMYDSVKLKGSMAYSFEELATAIYTFANTNWRYCTGGWYDPQTSLYHLDKVLISYDLKSALAMGRDHEQLAIFDLYNNKEIPIPKEYAYGIAG